MGSRPINSFIHDLPPIITAGNPAERGAEGFGVDGGGKVLARAVPGTSAAQQLGNEIAVEVRQARPETAGEVFRPGVVRMVRVFRPAADFGHLPNPFPTGAPRKQAS